MQLAISMRPLYEATGAHGGEMGEERQRLGGASGLPRKTIAMLVYNEEEEERKHKHTL